MARSRKQNSGNASSEGERVQKVLARAGLGSRRACEEYLTAGRVSIDGEVVTELGTKVDPDQQDVRVDGEPLKLEPKRYYLVNKPTNVVCTNRDPEGRTRAIDLVPKDRNRLFTVGRLDASSTGLLLVTNDGELANKLLHPRYKVPRVYHVQVAGTPSRETMEELKRGIHFSDGRFRIRHYRFLKKQGQSTFVELTLTEGRNREIRRLLARVGHKVLNLERVGFGPLRLGKLKPGQSRRLTDHEFRELRDLVRNRKASPPPPRRGKRSGKKSAGGKKTSATGRGGGKPSSKGGRGSKRSRRGKGR